MPSNPNPIEMDEKENGKGWENRGCEKAMTSRAMHTYKRDELESEVKQGRLEIIKLKAELSALQFKSEHALLDTAKSASQIGILKLVYQRIRSKRGGSLEIIETVLDD